jgi:hypothetical protein
VADTQAKNEYVSITANASYINKYIIIYIQFSRSEFVYLFLYIIYLFMYIFIY